MGIIKGKKVAKKTSLPDIGSIYRWRDHIGYVYCISISEYTDLGLNDSVIDGVAIPNLLSAGWYSNLLSIEVEIIESLDEGRDE